MFRESDMKERRMHPSYTNKPVVPMQKISQINHIDDSGLSNRNWQTSDSEIQPEIPTTWDTVYDPGHPDADWAGYVKIRPTKKHVQDPIAHRVGLEAGSGGYIVGKEEKADFARKSRSAGASKNESSFVIGGIDDADERYKTTYDRFSRQESTKRDQLSLVKRETTKRQVDDPAQARSSEHLMRDRLQAQQEQYAYEEYLQANQQYALEQELQRTEGKSTSLAGYRAPTFANKSLLSNIGESVVKNTDLKPPPQRSIPASDSTTKRLLLTENYRPYPGYTGKKM